MSLYDQLIVAYGGGLQLGPKLFLFGGVATVVVVALVGLIRRERPSGRGFLAGAVTVWSLTWIGSLLQSCQPPRRRDDPGTLVGDRLLAAGREHRRGDRRNHPGLVGQAERSQGQPRPVLEPGWRGRGRVTPVMRPYTNGCAYARRAWRADRRRCCTGARRPPPRSVRRGAAPLVARCP